MTDEDAQQLDEDLESFAKLRPNGAWKNHVVPEIERMRDEARARMRDESLTDSQRVHHIQAWENSLLLLEFLDKAEAQTKARLREFYGERGGFKERKFLFPPT